MLRTCHTDTAKFILERAIDPSYQEQYPDEGIFITGTEKNIQKDFLDDTNFERNLNLRYPCKKGLDVRERRYARQDRDLHKKLASEIYEPVDSPPNSTEGNGTEGNEKH